MHNLCTFTAVKIINTNIELLLAIASKSEDNGCCYVVERSCKDYSRQINKHKMKAEKNL